MYTRQQPGQAVRNLRPAVTTTHSLHTQGVESAGNISGVAFQRARQHPQAISPIQMMHLQRTIGNRAVANLLKQHSPEGAPSEKPVAEHAEPIVAANMIQAAPAPTQDAIQRKVYINKLFRGYKHKEKTSRGSEGTGDRNVNTMMEDHKSRYFKSKSEMSDYAANRTEKIGYVDKTRTWIRIPDKLLVIGENHSQTTLQDVVKAVGTDKYMYEAFTEHPAEAANNPELEASMSRRDAELLTNFNGIGAKPGDKSHYSESFYPKVIRGLQGIDIDGSFKIYGSGSEMRILSQAIRFAASADADSGLSREYNARKDLWEKTADSLEKDSSAALLTEAMKVEGNNGLFNRFVQEVTSYATLKLQAEQALASKRDKKKFAKHWKLADRDYDEAGSEIMKAENARDFSMFQHIKKAKRGGYLLYGLGNLHLQRLKKLLDKEGIQSINMNAFMAEQKAKHPQT